MPKYDGSIRINTKIETKDLNSQMMRVSNAIKKDSAALDSLNRKMEEFSQKKIPTEKFAELQRELEKAESENCRPVCHKRGRQRLSIKLYRKTSLRRKESCLSL